MDEKDFLLDSLRKMLVIRRFEEKAAQAYQQGKFGGFCHLYIGQEAVIVGIEAALRRDDYVITGYRDHGHGLMRGVTPEAGFAELLAKATGCSGGKGGSMHFYNAAENFMGGWGIVGGQIPLGAGLAFACKYKGDDRVAVAFLGDGAVPQGVVYESFNMASLWDLPLIVVVENNGYAMGTPLERSNAEHEELYRRAEPFGIECSYVGGMEVVEVRDHFRDLVAKVRETSRPHFVEVRTYRYRGHSMSDPIHGHYRTKEEVEQMKKADPIARVRGHLEDEHGMSEADLKAIDKEVRAEIAAAMKAAEAAPPPDASALHRDVYALEEA